jgi:hypothetical protein
MKNFPTISARSVVRIWLAACALFTIGSDVLAFIVPRTGPIADLTSRILLADFWVGTALTAIVLWLFYQGKAADSKFNPRWIMYVCISAWILYLLLIGSAQFMPFSEPYMRITSNAIEIAYLSTVPAIVVAFLGLGKPKTNQRNGKDANPVLLRVIGAAIVAALSIGTYAAVRAVWTPAEDGKFVYNNIANGLGCAALGLTIVLSYLQRDVYWLNHGRATKLDEREIQVRQQVFETSYKLGALLVFAAFCAVFTHRQSLLVMIQHDSSTPGNILWPFANVVIALFALPLLVAIYHKRTSRTAQ